VLKELIAIMPTENTNLDKLLILDKNNNHNNNNNNNKDTKEDLNKVELVEGLLDKIKCEENLCRYSIIKDEFLNSII
jgi:hypothetical protein